MNEHIATIQEFLTRGELRLARRHDIYLLISIDENGHAGAIKNPQYGRSGGVSITLTEKELAELASLCFPPKDKENA